MRPRTLLALLPAVLPAAACFEGRRTIRVNADGSGTIVDDLVLGEQMKAMMAMADAKSEEAEAKEASRFEAAAAAMGPGVTFVNEEKTPQGFQATFAFKDISQIKVGVSPGPEEEQGGGEKKEALRPDRRRRRQLQEVHERRRRSVHNEHQAASGGEGHQGESGPRGRDRVRRRVAASREPSMNPPFVELDRRGTVAEQAGL